MDALIAPFWADADTRDGRGTGHVYYRSTLNQTLLNRATEIVNTAFTGANFVSEHLYVVTWFEVGYFGQPDNSKVNLHGPNNTFMTTAHDMLATRQPQMNTD